MILSVFSEQNITHLIEIFFWMFGAFLIGLFFGRIITKEKTRKEKEKTRKEYDIKEFEDLHIKDDIPKIRATKTFERGGKETVKHAPKIKNSELNFDRIGKATLSNKNNLQNIKGIGALTEAKLNAIGIVNYEQLSNLNSEDIAKITELIKFFPGRIEQDDWVGQAFKQKGLKTEI